MYSNKGFVIIHILRTLIWQLLETQNNRNMNLKLDNIFTFVWNQIVKCLNGSKWKCKSSF